MTPVARQNVSAKLEKTATPGIYKRGNRYVVVYRDPGGRQRKRFARTLVEARDVKATLRADVARGEYRALSKVTFTDYASEWIETYAGRTSRGIGNGTRDDYRDALERDAAPFFGRMRLAAIEPRDVKRFVTQLSARGLAPGSVRKAVAPVRALFATAVEEGVIRANPAAGLRIAQPGADLEEAAEEAIKALSEKELRRVLRKLPGEWRFFFELLAQAGLRIGEAIELRWGDVDGSWLRVRRRYYRGAVGLPKGRKKRSVPLSRELAQQLWALRKESHAGGNELVFTSARGQRVDPSNLMSRVLKPAGRAAEVGDWIGFHTFRHTCATMLFRQGWNAVQVQNFLGHSDPGFTLRTYVHLLPEDLPIPMFGGKVPEVRKERGPDKLVDEQESQTSLSSDGLLANLPSMG